MICSLLLAFFLSSNCYAQTKISGKVLDFDSGLPIELAHVIESINQRATITDENGEFKIEIGSFPVMLYVSHIGYETTSFLLKENPNNILTLKLKEQEQKVDEVVVIGDRVQYFFERESFDIVNYEFGDGFIWVIGYPDKNRAKPQLRIISLGANTKAKMDLPSKGELYRDAFGQTHLFARDSVYQLCNLEDSIVLLFAMERNEATESLIDLKVLIGSRAIIKEPNDNGFLKSYYLYNLNDSTRSIFFQAYDRDLFASSAQSARYRHSSIPDIIFPPGRGGFINDATGAEPATNFMIKAQDRLLNYAPVFCEFFSFENGLIIVQDKGPLYWIYNEEFELKCSDRIPIPDKGFNIEMMQDPATELVYLAHERHGQRFITRLDPSTGDVLGIMKIGSFAFIENIKIYGNRVYFTQHATTNEQNFNLFSVAFENNHIFQEPPDNSPLNNPLIKPAINFLLRK